LPNRKAQFISENMIRYKIFIDGAAGTTGLQIAERLTGQAELELVTLKGEARKHSEARKQAMADADITILCLPDEAAIEAVAMARELGPETRLIDASSAHRIDPEFTYGFAELSPEHSQRIADSALVSNPGCYPTGFISLVKPLIDAGILHPDTGLSAACVSGYSGGGKAMIARYEAGDASAFGTYGLSLSHKHLPEMRQHTGLTHSPVFLPSVGQFAQGMLVNIPLHQAQFAKNVSAQDLWACYTAAYAGMKLISVEQENGLDRYGFLAAEALAGTDRMQIFVFNDPENEHFVLTARLDNLGKGAAGAAVQNLNLMLGIDEMRGLNL